VGDGITAGLRSVAVRSVWFYSLWFYCFSLADSKKEKYEMVIFLPVLVSLIGVLMYALCTDAKLQAIGKDMFWVGLLAFLLTYSGQAIKIP